MTSEDSYVTFRGVSVTGATSNYYRVARAYAHAACIGGMLRRCFQDTMDCPPVQWVYVLDSGQRSSVTVNHPFPPPSRLAPLPPPPPPPALPPPLYGRVASARRTTKGGSNPDPLHAGSTCRCLYVLTRARVRHICACLRFYLCTYDRERNARGT